MTAIGEVSRPKTALKHPEGRWAVRFLSIEGGVCRSDARTERVYAIERGLEGEVEESRPKASLQLVAFADVKLQVTLNGGVVNPAVLPDFRAAEQDAWGAEVTACSEREVREKPVGKQVRPIRA